MGWDYGTDLYPPGGPGDWDWTLPAYATALTAVHESAHAVVARETGALGGRLWLTDDGQGLTQYRWPAWQTTDPQRFTAFRLAVAAAGMVAEEHWWACFRRKYQPSATSAARLRAELGPDRPSPGDLQVIADGLKLPGPYQGDRARVMRRSRALVLRHWSQITELARTTIANRGSASW